MTDRTYARIAGAAYIVIIIVALVSVAPVESKLIVAGDDTATAGNISGHDLLFRLSIIGTITIYVSVVILSWALYVILKPVNKNLALLALLLRSAEAIVGAATALISFVVLLLVQGNGDPEQLHALVGVFLNVRTAGLDVVLIFIGIGGTLFCYLFFASRYVPRALAAWGMFTYASMFLLAVVSILVPDHPVMLENVLYGVGSAFELAIGLWLLIKGVTP